MCGDSNFDSPLHTGDTVMNENKTPVPQKIKQSKAYKPWRLHVIFPGSFIILPKHPYGSLQLTSFELSSLRLYSFIQKCVTKTSSLVEWRC